jgi:hypothetical protein
MMFKVYHGIIVSSGIVGANMNIYKNEYLTPFSFQMMLDGMVGTFIGIGIGVLSPVIVSSAIIALPAIVYTSFKKEF